RNSSNDLNAVSLTHDALGNVTSRVSEFERVLGASTHIQESYTYDGLNRLRRTQQSFTDVNGTLTTTQNTTNEQRYDVFGISRSVLGLAITPMPPTVRCVYCRSRRHLMMV